MGERRVVWLDVFSDRGFGGNALAVVPEASGLYDAQMSAIARELNLSETTFVTPSLRPEATHRVRIFTPTRELAFAGHPVVGTAVALAELTDASDVLFTFELEAGLASVRVERQSNDVRSATVIAPQLPRLVEAPPDADELLQQVGLHPDDFDPAIPVHVVDSAGTAFLVAVVRTLDALARCRAAPAPDGIVGIYVACADGAEWRARMFAPRAGIIEDPASGSAACGLAATLHRYQPAYGPDATYGLRVVQGVEMGRRSELDLSFDVAAGHIAQVRLRGAAVRVLDGHITEP